jgi:hypothetical protein
MKTAILLVFSFFLFTLSLHGQKFSYKSNSLIKDSKLTNNYSGFSKTDTTLKLFPNLDLFHRRNNRNFDLHHDKAFEDFVIVKGDPPYAFPEEFPGSSKYYAKSPSLLQAAGENHFIVKPDTSSKYYLMIIDPEGSLFSSK